MPDALLFAQYEVMPLDEMQKNLICLPKPYLIALAYFQLHFGFLFRC